MHMCTGPAILLLADSLIATQRDVLGSGPLPTVMFDVACDGSESTLSQCDFSESPGSLSTHEIAGVRCVPGECAHITFFLIEHSCYLSEIKNSCIPSTEIIIIFWKIRLQARFLQYFIERCKDFS